MRSSYIYSAIIFSYAMVSCGTAVEATSGSDVDNSINIGYGTASKNAQAFSISEIKMAEGEESIFNDIYDYLRSKVPGVDVGESSGAGVPRITVRGVRTIGEGSQSNPLFIIDGNAVDDLNIILPNQVHSVQVLKGPAASTYGAKGANGVIMIMTKFAYEEAQREAEARKAARAEKKQAKKN